MTMFDLEGTKGYITAQSVRTHHPHPTQLPAITISRQAGAGANTIAHLAANRLNAKHPRAECKWTTFDKKLVEKVIEDHGLANQIRKFMEEDHVAELKDAVEEMLGLHPSQWKLVHYTTDTIIRLAQAGNSIIVGRGANEITARMKHVLRVFLVAPLPKRISHVADYYGLSRDEAEEFVHKTDRARRRYVQHNFSGRIDDPLNYDLTLNTGSMTFEEAADVLVETLDVLKPTPKE